MKTYFKIAITFIILQSFSHVSTVESAEQDLVYTTDIIANIDLSHFTDVHPSVMPSFDSMILEGITITSLSTLSAKVCPSCHAINSMTRLSEEQLEITDIQNITLKSLDPIYIGGARYQLTLADFTPIYSEMCDCAGLLTPKLTGYKTSVPVDGDFGQDLHFDIFGDSGTQSMEITAKCGSYNDSDSGTKYVMSKTQSTEGSCQTLDITFSTSGPASSINLNILIYEQL